LGPNPRPRRNSQTAMARAKAAKIGFRQVNTKSSLEQRKIFTRNSFFQLRYGARKARENPEMACPVMLLRGDSSSAAPTLHSFLALAPSRTIARAEAAEPLSFGRRWRSRACISRSSAGPHACYETFWSFYYGRHGVRTYQLRCKCAMPCNFGKNGKNAAIFHAATLMSNTNTITILRPVRWFARPADPRSPSRM
jgi:hypothetical protein